MFSSCFFFLSFFMYTKNHNNFNGKVPDEFPPFSSIYYYYKSIDGSIWLESHGNYFAYFFPYHRQFMCSDSVWNIVFILLRRQIAKNVDVSNSLFSTYVNRMKMKRFIHYCMKRWNFKSWSDSESEIITNITYSSSICERNTWWVIMRTIHSIFVGKKLHITCIDDSWFMM